MKSINMNILRPKKYFLIPSALLLIPDFAHAAISYTLESFISVTSIQGLIVSILNVFIIVATPIIVFFVIYSGFMYVTAKGNAEQIKKATTMLTYSIIGGLLIIGSVAMAEIVKAVIDEFIAS